MNSSNVLNFEVSAIFWYTKKIGLDIFDKYGEQFSFDLEVFAKYGPKGRNLNSVKAARLFR